ncbi:MULTISPECIES: MFS transporter [Bacillus cereus group]|uniref:MFS transporter n=1 Tax=Bacillus cereus group TaxID=86661 RepID=UPI000BEB79E1|nr:MULTISPECIES: MFS transporter [Bacillus cereus group]PDY73310.1 MFS transporter [Bacillus cereus]PEB95814.1 MFS transporter [Bacillus cereus]PEC24553.1 MFS transporter [Bacillus thuringiensis]PEC76847.1 MFS transporter [Bacillus cereus]PEE13272.1 MFS transporter [Bacillus cereus]
MSESLMKKQDEFGESTTFIPYWWKVVLAFTLGTIFLNADRYILNPILGEIGLEYNLNNTQLGLVNSIFFFTYTIAQIPAGTLSDKFGRKIILVPGFILFGIFTGVSGIMAGFTGFLVARALTGLTQATYYGPQFALSSEAIPNKRRSIGSAIINSGAALGISLGFISSSTLVLEWGINWRMMFYIFSVLTILCGLFIGVVVKEGKRQKKDVNNPVIDVEADISMLSLLKNRNLLITFIVLFCSIYGFTVIMTWLPKYLQVERGFQGSEIGFISSLVPWAAIPGSLFVGYLSDKYGKKKIFVFTLVPIAAISLWATVYIQSIPLMIGALIIYGLFGKIALDPVLIATVSENVNPESYGRAFSLYNFIGMSSSIVAPFIAGYLADLTGSMAAGFYSAVIILGISLIIMMFFKEASPHTHFEEGNI